MTRQITRPKFLLLVLLLLLAGVVAPVSAQETQTDYTIQVVQIDTSRFPLIEVWVSVIDSQGNPVGTLPAETFALIENGEPVEVSEVYQAGEQGSVTTVLAIDRSGSMNDIGKLDAAKAAATTFVDLMRPADATGITAFNTQVDVVHPVTGEKARLRDAIDGLQAFDDTAMYDALSVSVDQLASASGRRAVIILSDGLDNSSQRTADDILDSVEQAELSIYAIGLGDPSLGVGSTAGIDEAALRAIAEQSRGLYMFAPQPDALSDLYQQLSQRLQNEYRLTYVSPNALHDGIERGIEVRVAETGSIAQTEYNPGGVIPETARALGWPLFAALLAGLIVLLAAPDILRRITGSGTGRGTRRRSGRVKLTEASPGAKRVGKSPSGTPRVRIRDKGKHV